MQFKELLPYLVSIGQSISLVTGFSVIYAHGGWVIVGDAQEILLGEIIFFSFLAFLVVALLILRMRK